MNYSQHIKVWDPLIRIFHWTLVTAFAVAYLTEDDWMRVHAFAGYVITGLLVFRLLWGFLGTRYARFSDFVFAPRVVLQYLREKVAMRARRYIGHNPAAGAMIIALLLSLVATTLSGLALYGISEHAGPMVKMLSGFGPVWEDPLKEIHEFFANFTLALVFIHVAGVIFESLVHRENLVRSMWTGTKRAADSQ